MVVWATHCSFDMMLSPCGDLLSCVSNVYMMVSIRQLAYKEILIYFVGFNSLLYLDWFAHVYVETYVSVLQNVAYQRGVS